MNPQSAHSNLYAPVSKIRVKPATSTKFYSGNVIQVSIVSGFKLVG